MAGRSAAAVVFRGVAARVAEALVAAGGVAPIALARLCLGADTAAARRCAVGVLPAAFLIAAAAAPLLAVVTRALERVFVGLLVEDAELGRVLAGERVPSALLVGLGVLRAQPARDLDALRVAAIELLVGRRDTSWSLPATLPFFWTPSPFLASATRCWLSTLCDS